MIEEGTIVGHEADHERGRRIRRSRPPRCERSNCIRRLPDDQRVVLLMCDVEDLRYDEAAEALGLPLGTVKSRLFRARAAMRKLLIESGEL
ncbi:MAG: sigma factor-like helix-turn-helix DNA-binding protein [Chloroflexia bacterium]